MDDLLERLLADARVLGPSGIERIAWSWKLHHQGVDEALAVAQQAVRESGRQQAWAEAESAVRALTEGSHAQQAWKAEDPETDRTAEDALLHAALAIVIGEHISVDQRRALLKPAAEALPWLLPDEPPDEGPRRA